MALFTLQHVKSHINIELVPTTPPPIRPNGVAIAVTMWVVANICVNAVYKLCETHEIVPLGYIIWTVLISMKWTVLMYNMDGANI